MEAEFGRRWDACGHLFRSPIDGSPLSHDAASNVLRDASGNGFPMADDVPVLMPHVEQFLKDHFAVSRRSGATHPWLLGSTAELLAKLRNEELITYVFGYRIIVSAAESVISGPAEPGTLAENDGQPVIHTSDGAIRPLRMRLEWSSVRAESWHDIRIFLRLTPPYFLLSESFPSTDLVVLYEVLPWLGDAFAGGARAISDATPQNLAKAPGFVANVPYYRWLYDAYGLDTETGGAVDIGCGDGFLAAALEAAGMRHVIGTDLRRPSLATYVSQYPEAQRSLLGMADMFAWCYPPDAFSLINVRNNSAFAFATAFGGPFPAFARSMASSLRADGLAYLSSVTDGSASISPPYTNRPVTEFLDLFSGNGLVPVKLMKLGSGTGFLLVRPENAGLADKVRAVSEGQRHRALRDYLAWSPGDATDALRNQFLAVADFASEIALTAYKSGKRTVTLWGEGILAYQTWRMLGVQHPHITVGGFVCAKKADAPSAFNIVTPEQAERSWGEDQLRVDVDLAVYERILAGKGRASDRRSPDLTFFGATASEALAEGDAAAGPWSFNYLSGDQDQSLPAIAAGYYFTGYLRLLDTDADAASPREFEKRFRHAFPHGCTSIA